MYADFQNYWGVDDAPVLVWKASSLLMNPSLGKRELDAQRKLDPLRYAREFEAEFIDAIDAFIPARWIENAVERDRVDNPPSPEFRRVWTIDQSERRGDAFVFVTGHQEDDGTAVIDCVRSWSATDNATVNLETTVQEIVNIGSRYGENPLFIGDQSSQGWVAEAFQRAGASFIKSEINTSDCYLAAEPFFAQGRVRLPDNPALVRELKLLERHSLPGGRVRVDHPRGGHDDLAAAVCRAIANAEDGGWGEVWSGGGARMSVAREYRDQSDVADLVSFTHGPKISRPDDW